MDAHHVNKEDVQVAESKQENQENLNKNSQTTNGDENRSSSNNSSNDLNTEQQEDGETLSMSFPPRHLQRRYQSAETTQVVSTNTALPSKRFHTGTQFLCTTYLGEAPVLLPVWSNITVGEQNTTGSSSSSAEIKEDIQDGRERHQQDRYQESKIETSIPTAQHLPPGANTRIAEKKKKKIPRRGEGNNISA